MAALCAIAALLVFFSVLKSLFQPKKSRACGMCGNPLHKNYYVWTTPAKKKVSICTHCNQRAERANSSAAWNHAKVRGKAQDDISKSFDEIY
jgi:hypothetical protein